MRIKIALGIWLLGIALAWFMVAPTDLGLLPLIDTQGAASGLWHWRQHTIYLTGLWSIGLMSLIMLLAMRLPVAERLLGGMDQVYRLHKWAGISVAITSIAHWGAKEAGDWIKEFWGRDGHPAREAVISWFTDSRGLAKDVGEWAFYIFLAMVVITLWQRLLPYQRWRIVHRAMPLLYLALVFHTVALMPLYMWSMPLGLLMGTLLLLGSVAAILSLAGWIGLRRRHAAHIHALHLLGTADSNAPLEVVCAMPSSWPGHRAGQFAFVRFDALEGAHPFTIASAPGSLGVNGRGETLLRLVIKPLGDYTASLQQRLQVGQTVQIEGPYGCFNGDGQDKRQQVWIAAGVGITPFLALLETRQPGAAPVTEKFAPVQMHYCTRDAAHDPLLERVRELCAHAVPPVRLTVHSDAEGQRLQPKDLAGISGELDIWFCGPPRFGAALDAQASGKWRLHRESFAMR